MLEDGIDKAASGIKAGIGWIREHKNKLIAGALVGAGTIAGIGVVTTVAKYGSEDEDYMCLEESDIEVSDYDPDCECEDSEIETKVEVTVEE